MILGVFIGAVNWYDYLIYYVSSLLKFKYLAGYEL